MISIGYPQPREDALSVAAISYNFGGQTMEKNHHDTVLQQFNAAIDCWINRLDNYTFEMLCRQPAEGQWSLGQVYVNIIADTKYFIEQMKVALSDDQHSGKEMHADAKAIFARGAFPDIQLNNPFPESVHQPGSKEELARGLLKIKNETGSLLYLYDFSASRGKSLHPGLQFFTAMEWLQFAGMHMRHHFGQKNRIDAALTKAGGA